MEVVPNRLPMGINLGPNGTIVTNGGPGTVSYGANSNGTVDGTIASGNSWTLYDTQFFASTTRATLNLLPLAASTRARDKTSSVYIPSDECLLRYRRAITRARHGGSACRVTARGDSTTYGVLSGTNPNSEVRKDYNWCTRAKVLLQAGQLLPGRVDDSIMHFANADDSRFSYTGGGNFGTLITGQTMVSALEAGYDAVDVCVLRSGAAGDIVVTGTEVVGTPLTLSLSGVTNNQAATFRIPMSSTIAHTFTIAGPASGTAQVLNMEPVLTTAPTILKLGGAGVSGQTLATLAPTLTGSGTNMEKILRNLPDLELLFMGVNDMRGSSDLAGGAATYKANLAAFITAFQAQGSDVAIIVFPSYNSNQSGMASADESRLFHRAIYDLADQYNVAVLDLQSRWGYGVTSTTGASTTPVTNSAMYDGTHPTLYGYRDLGRMVAGFLADAAA